MAHRPAVSAEESVIGEGEVDAEGYPELREHRVARGAQEAVDSEVLLHPLEEQLNLPALAVDLGDRRGSEVEGIGEKRVMLAGLGIPIADPAQRQAVASRLDALQVDDLVAGHASAHRRSTLSHAVRNH